MGKSKSKNKKSNDTELYIKVPGMTKSINPSLVISLSNIDYPLFSYKYLQNVSFNKQKDASFFHEFICRLHQYSTLGWQEKQTSGRHSFGFEYLPQTKMKHSLPTIITPDVDLMILRSSNDNKALVGFREWNIFHIIFIEANFNDIYDHSS